MRPRKEIRKQAQHDRSVIDCAISRIRPARAPAGISICERSPQVYEQIRRVWVPRRRTGTHAEV
jgi:hypothetical protein